jgi:hypothetical protein
VQEEKRTGEHGRKGGNYLILLVGTAGFNWHHAAAIT